MLRFRIIIYDVAFTISILLPSEAAAWSLLGGLGRDGVADDTKSDSREREDALYHAADR